MHSLAILGAIAHLLTTAHAVSPQLQSDVFLPGMSSALHSSLASDDHDHFVTEWRNPGHSMSMLGSSGDTTTWALACPNGDNGIRWTAFCQLPSPYLTVTIAPTAVGYNQTGAWSTTTRISGTPTTITGSEPHVWFHSCSYTTVTPTTPTTDSMGNPTTEPPYVSAVCTERADQDVQPRIDPSLRTYTMDSQGSTWIYNMSSEYYDMTILRPDLYTLPAPLSAIVYSQTEAISTYANGDTAYISPMLRTVLVETQTLTITETWTNTEVSKSLKPVTTGTTTDAEGQQSTFESWAWVHEVSTVTYTTVTPVPTKTLDMEIPESFWRPRSTSTSSALGVKATGGVGGAVAAAAAWAAVGML